MNHTAMETRRNTNVIWVLDEGEAGRAPEARVCGGLTALGYRVFVVGDAHGRRDNEAALKAVIEHAASLGTQYELTHEGSTSVFLGFSRGAALAHAAATVDARGRGAVLVCPDLSCGVVRWDALFKKPPLPGTRRGVVYGTCDRHAAWLMPKGWHEAATSIGVFAGHELCVSVDVRLLDDLLQDVTSRTA